MVSGLRTTVAPAPQASPIATRTIPPDQQPVSFRGIEILVPATLSFNATHCGAAREDTVVQEDGPVRACFLAQKPGLTVVRIEEFAGDQVPGVVTRAVQLDGVPALRGVGTPIHHRGIQSVLAVPSRRVLIAVESPDTALRERIIDSARIVEIDSTGCPSTIESPDPPPTDRRGATDSLVPDQPSGATICRYANTELHRSTRLDATETAAIQRILNGLAEGASPTLAPCHATGDERNRYVVRFDYPSGPTLAVYSRIDGCEAMWASNGVRTTEVSKPLVDLLIAQVGFRGGSFSPPWREK